MAAIVFKNESARRDFLQPPHYQHVQLFFNVTAIGIDRGGCNNLTRRLLFGHFSHP